MGVDDLPKETLIDGRYEIRERLGSGGMGTVYRASDKLVGGMVAVKMLREGRPGAAISKEDRQKRFAREVLALNQVDHPNVVRIEHFGFYKGAPYMVMQLLAGKDLAALLRENGGPFSIDHAVDIVVAICVVIRACHEAKVIHRDLKPENVMIVKRDVGLGWEAKIVDFGIAKLDATDDLTQEGRIAGTPAYLAPEQISDKPGPASDQYAIGVLLYLCLTGVHPYAGFSGLPLIRAIEKGVFKDPREHRTDLPTELAAVVCKAMHVDPAQRFESVFELGRALRPFCSPLGQQLWKSYYDTPPVRGGRRDAKASAVGIPLVRQIADHGAGSMGAQTVQAHYESTTAVGKDTVPDTIASAPRFDTAVESRPVAAVVQPSSATAVDVARIELGSKHTRPHVHGDSSSTRVKRRAPRVVSILMAAAVLGGAGAWFLERGLPRLRAPVAGAAMVRPVPSVVPASSAPGTSGSGTGSATARSSAPPVPTLQAKPTEVAGAKPTDESDHTDPTKVRPAHHHHREISSAAHVAQPEDTKGAADLIAAADEAFDRGDWTGATALGRKAIEKGGGQEAYLLVGDGSFKTNDFATARAMYEEVLKRNPSSELARRRLELVAGKEKQASNRRP